MGRTLMLIAAVFAVLSLSVLHAEPADNRNTTLPSYTVGVELLNYEPFYFNNDKGYQGFAREVFDLFQRQFHLRLTYIALPVDELKEQFYNKKFDFKFPDDPDWQLDKYKHIKVHYSNAVVSYVDGVCIKRSLANTPIQRIGIPRGFDSPLSSLAAGQATIVVIEKDSIEELLHDLVKGEIDGAWGSMDVFRYKAKRYGKFNLNVDLTLPHKIGAYSLSTIDQVDVLTLFNRFLINNQEKILELETKWRIDALRQLRHAQFRREKPKKQ